MVTGISDYIEHKIAHSKVKPLPIMVSDIQLSMVIP